MQQDIGHHQHDDRLLRNLIKTVNLCHTQAAWWVFVIGFTLSFVSLVFFAAIFGIDRQDRFELLIISIDWLVLIVNGILLSLAFA